MSSIDVATRLASYRLSADRIDQALLLKELSRNNDFKDIVPRSVSSEFNSNIRMIKEILSRDRVIHNNQAMNKLDMYAQDLELKALSAGPFASPAAVFALNNFAVSLKSFVESNRSVELMADKATTGDSVLERASKLGTELTNIIDLIGRTTLELIDYDDYGHDAGVVLSTTSDALISLTDMIDHWPEAYHVDVNKLRDLMREHGSINSAQVRDFEEWVNKYEKWRSDFKSKYITGNKINIVAWMKDYNALIGNRPS